MLNKYQNFIKISKSQECSLYYAFNKQNLQKVLIKRIKQSSSWADLLDNKHLKYQSKHQFFMKKIQIFKDKGYFFIVYQKPYGPPFSQRNDFGKLEASQFYVLFFNLVEAVRHMLKNIDGLYIYPEWIFTHRNLIKICHFQPFFPLKNQSKSVHVYMFDAQKKLLNPQLQISQSNLMPFEKNKNIVFNLGLIAYNMITGRSIKKVQTKQQYQAQLKSLELNAEKRLQQCLKDQSMSKFIANMLKSEGQQIFQFQPVFNTFKRKAIQHKPKDNEFAHSVSFKMQKIQINNPNSIKTFKKKKMYRPCCRTFEDEELIQQEKARSQQKKQKKIPSQQKIIKTSKIKLKAISKQKQPQLQGIKTNRHVSCFFPQLNSNRYKLILHNTNISRPTMFRSMDSIKRRILD